MRSMAPPLYAQHGSAPLCAAWLRHDAEMLVTPRAGMQSGEWRRTNRCARVGRRRLHPQRTKKRARPAPLPVTIPSGDNAARRSLALAATTSRHHPALHTFSPSTSNSFSFRNRLYLAVTLTAQFSSSRSAKDPGNSGSFAECRLRRCRHVPRGTAEFASHR
jgi:hypothetical protein